ncbi:MAG: F0F1 ATP synthase subunit delta [Rhizobiaceae bacterium]|nr:F0F1 ATP synthase subunit delta [Rhizobiaceae bacterium]
MNIDWWTLGLQASNVLILVWLLQHFFWRPVAAVIAKRRSDTQKLLDDAAQKRVQADATLAEMEKTRAGFAAERDAILVAAKTDGERTKAQALEAARMEAETLQKAARAAIARDTATAQKASADQAATLAVDIAKRLAARLEGPAVEAAFLGWLINAIKALTPAEKQAVADGTLDLVSAQPLEPAEQTRIEKQIIAAFGTQPEITFRVDRALIAGFELRSPHFLLRNSWQADLQRISKDLRDAA